MRSMSRHTIPTRGAARGVTALAGVSVLLASCSLSIMALHATGQPSLSLSAPLTSVACTTSGACIALGASGGANAPTTAAQVRNRKGVWSALRVPAAPVASFDAGACATTRCLFGGTGETGDLLWSINANTGAVAAKVGPAGGLAVRDLSCTNDLECAVVDQAAHSLTRLSFTTNAGRTWSAPRTIAWAADATTALECLSVERCYLASSSTRHVVSLRETLNRGATWRMVKTPATWRSLGALQCAAACTALVNSVTGSAVATQSLTTATSTVAAKTIWTATPIKFHASAFACAGASPCLIVGSVGAQSGAMAQWQAGVVHSVALSYVPSALTDVACQPSACVAIGVSTVVALHP